MANNLRRSPRRLAIACECCIENILSRIPGEYLAPDHYALPNPATTTEKTATAVANVPHIGRVRIVYKRMYSRRGKFGNHFWTPAHAEAILPAG